MKERSKNINKIHYYFIETSDYFAVYVGEIPFANTYLSY